MVYEKWRQVYVKHIEHFSMAYTYSKNSWRYLLGELAESDITDFCEGSSTRWFWFLTIWVCATYATVKIRYMHWSSSIISEFFALAEIYHLGTNCTAFVRSLLKNNHHQRILKIGKVLEWIYEDFTVYGADWNDCFVTANYFCIVAVPCMLLFHNKNVILCVEPSHDITKITTEMKKCGAKPREQIASEPQTKNLNYPTSRIPQCQLDASRKAELHHSSTLCAALISEKQSVLEAEPINLPGGSSANLRTPSGAGHEDNLYVCSFVPKAHKIDKK